MLLQQTRLQCERDQRRAEHQGAIDHVATALAATDRVEHRNQQIQAEEQQQEGLGRAEFMRRVVEHAPNRTDTEGEHEAKQIEQAPRAATARLRPGDGEDAEIEHGVVREQRDVIAAAGG